MGLLQVLAAGTIVVPIMLVLAAAIFIGRERLERTYAEYPERIGTAAPYVGILVVVLLLNSAIRPIGQDISSIINQQIGFVDLNISALIYGIEREFVVSVQQFITPELTAFFSFVYVYGYIFLLVFPFLAYLALDRPRPLQELSIAYTANYAIGLCFYLLFISYGPRNLHLVQEPMYDVYPQVKLLTTTFNANTNVFPSLHTSLSATVMFFAWRTREQYPRWLPFALFLGTSVVVSTMYLGIHWLLDVLAGVGLATVSYAIGIRVAERWEPQTPKLPRIADHFGR